MIVPPHHKSQTAAEGLPPEGDNVSSQRPAARRIKVMYIINDLTAGGAEMMLYKLLTESDRERFDPVVISLIDRGALRQQIEALGVTVHTARMKPGLPTPLGLWRLVRLVRRLKPDLIFGWMYHSCLAGQLANIFSPRGKAVLWSIHSSIGSIRSEKWITAAAIRVCARLSRLPRRIIFVSHVGQKMHGTLGYTLDHSCVIPNGIEAARFVPSGEARALVRSELGLSEKAFLIGLVGRYHPMKDHANFLRAAARLSKLHPEINFLLIGRGVDSENQALGRMIEALGLGGRTHLLGDRSDMPRLMAALDIFSLASSYGESFPNVIGEAMACGVPCVVTDVGDAVWIVGETGRVVPPRDAAALADAWKEMIDLGLEGREALGRAARSRVIDLFPLQSIVGQYEALYEAVLNTATPEKLAHAGTAFGSMGFEKIKPDGQLSPPPREEFNRVSD